MYTHQPISRENAEIRLVRFTSDNGNNGDQRISLELRPASLKDESVRYAALSYVWGDTETELMEVEINGFPFLVMQNLHKGLKSLLRIIGGNDPPWLWADAICIDQFNQIERTWQVAQMHDIYKRADPVYMLLGSGSVKIHHAMELIASVGPRAVASGILEASVFPSQKIVKKFADFVTAQSQPSEQDKKKDSTKYPGLFQLMYELINDDRLHTSTRLGHFFCRGISELLRKDYWHRIWIIQEVALARNPILVCGDESVPLEYLDGTVHVIRYCNSTMAYDKEGNLAKLERLAWALVETNWTSYRWTYAEDTAKNRFNWLVYFSKLAARLSGHGTLLLIPETLSEVFTSLTRAFLKDESTRYYFDLDRCVPSKDQGDSPSWVPDWTRIGREGLCFYPIDYSRYFSATHGGLSPKDDSDLRSPILRRPGCYVDMITEVMELSTWSQPKSQFLPIRDVESWLKTIIDFTKLGPESGPAEDYIWRTVMRGDRHDQKRSGGPDRPPSVSDTILGFIRKFMRQESIDAESLMAEEAQYVSEGIFRFDEHRPESKSLDTKLSHVLRRWPVSIGASWRGRTLFKTNKEMLGLGHAAIQPGDHVTLLWGQASPIILRPRNGRDASDGFRFLGDAYVDGIMYGEYLKNDPEHVIFDIM
ncbi:hypothetical protein E8E14_000290 [Neopestalotiopsis sp. 37M]|nr:hypothetical protein E8E14_000290 [Neopestalotiopsis sp. 37M]